MLPPQLPNKLDNHLPTRGILWVGHIDKTISDRGWFCRCFCLSRFLLRSRRLPQASAPDERIRGSRKASSACAASRSQPTRAPEIRSLLKRGSTPAVSATSSRRAVNSSCHSAWGRPLFPHRLLQVECDHEAGVSHLGGITSERCYQFIRLPT